MASDLLRGDLTLAGPEALVDVEGDYSKRHRGWVFTHHHYSPQCEEVLQATLPEVATYAIYGRELTKEGTPHLQGYFELKEGKTRHALIEWFKKSLPERVLPDGKISKSISYLAKRKGTPKQAADYCQKEFANGSYVWQHGKQPDGAGARNDIKTIKKDVLQNKTLGDMIDQGHVTSYAHIRIAQVLASELAPKRVYKPLVIWLDGPTGVGKTSLAYRLASLVEGGEVYSCLEQDDRFRYYDGCHGQSIMLFDEFRAGKIGFSFLLKILDHYPLVLPVKGSTTQMRSPVVVITSPDGPVETYSNKKDEDVNQLLRRIDVHITLSKVEGGSSLHFNLFRSTYSDLQISDEVISSSLLYLIGYEEDSTKVYCV